MFRFGLCFPAMAIAVLCFAGTPLIAQVVLPPPPPNAEESLAERLKVLDSELERLQTQGQADAAQSLRSQLSFVRALHRGDFPKAQSQPLELHAVSILGGGERFPDAPTVASTRRLHSAEISVTYVSAPIILFVNAGEDLHINFAIDPRARVLAVVFGGTYQHISTGLPRDAFVYYASAGSQQLGVVAMKQDRESANRLMKALRVYFQREPMTLTVAEFPFGKPIVVGPENDNWKAQYALSHTDAAYQQLLEARRRNSAASLAHLRFTGSYYDFGNRNYYAASGEFTLAGPEMRSLRPMHRHIRQLIATSNGRHHYALAGSAFLRFDPTTGTGAPVPQLKQSPTKMAFSAIAFDEKRSRFFLTGLDPPHAIHAFVPADGHWELLAPSAPNLAALVYSPAADQFLGVTLEYEFVEHERTAASVVRLRADGQLLESFRPQQEIWPSWSQWGGTTLTEVDGKLIIAVPPVEDERGENRSHIHVVDLKTHEVPYSGVLEIHDGAQNFRATPPVLDQHYGRPLRRMFDQLAIADDIARGLRREGRLPEAERLATRLAMVRNRLSGTASVAEQVEPHVHVVSNLATKEVVIDVESRAEPAILFLCSREAVKWRIRVANGAQLQRVIIAENERQMIEEIPTDAIVDTYTRNPGDNGLFVGRNDQITLQIISELTREKVGRLPWTVHQIEQPETATLTIGPSNGDWTMQCIQKELDELLTGPLAERQARNLQSLSDVSFESVYRTRDATRPGEFVERFRYGAFTPRGPSPQQLSELPTGFTGMVTDDVTGDRYGLREQRLIKVSGITGDLTLISSEEAIPDVPTFSHLTFDAQRRRLLLSNERLYAYDLAARRWSTPSGLDLQTRNLAHSPAHDLLCGVSATNEDQKLTLHLFNMNEALIGAYQLPGIAGTAHAYGYASYLPQIDIACAGDYVAIIGPPVRDPLHNSRFVPEIRVFNLRSLAFVYVGLLPMRPAIRDLTLDRLQENWNSLAGDDTSLVEAAIWELAAGDRDTVDFIAANLPHAPSLAEAQIRKLIAELESDDFVTRRTALEQLEKQGRAILPLLLEFAEHPSAEVRASIQRLLRAANAEVPQTPELAREVRAMQVLELIATPEAVKALQDIASGPPNVERTVAAKAALERLSSTGPFDEP